MDNRVLVSCGQVEHRGWNVVRDGFYGRPPRRRQQYRCADPVSGKSHRFTPTVMRLEATEPHCLECESELHVGQGPTAARHHDFAAREIAAALVAVANGATYSQAAMTARQSVVDLVGRHHPELRTPRGRRVQPGQVDDGGVSRHCTLVTSWVDAYTDLVLGDDPVEAPRVLLLDSTSFYRRGGGRVGPAFSVLFAYGYPSWPGPGRLLRAAVYRSATTVAWTDFLSAMPGMPEVIVADGAQDIRQGVLNRWPVPGANTQPELVACRWHLAQRLRRALVEDMRGHVSKPEQHPLYERVERAFDSDEAWGFFFKVAYGSLIRFDVESLELPAAVKWMNRNEVLVRTQLARRPHRPGPEATGPLETEIQFFRERLSGRAQVLRNQPRTNHLLRLMVAARNGQADERAWADRIRRHLLDTDGWAPRQRQLAGAGGL